MSTLREELEKAKADAFDMDPVIHCTASDRYLDEYIGLRDAAGFTAWTATRVYFPLAYDGNRWIGSAPRNPCPEQVQPLGDGG